MGSSSVISPQDVLESLMNDGTIDSLRLKIINQLKANEELKNRTIKMSEQSKVLNTPGAEKQTKRELFDALQQELDCSIYAEITFKPVLENWELILNSDGLGKDISKTVERVFSRLSGREPLLFPLPNVETQPCKETEKGKEKGKEKEHENEKDNSNSALKKRRYTEMNEEGGDNEVAK
ncbi:hypothetical protein LWI28_028424 [Acer negundo]|uniref:Uncharacterized protein n=1 Tax=Acer negundo TaxID=4023 RepID=A0AAD5J7W9_ACENE|nr:hypothetical protein LWI28_028424 [Acer negundo]